MKRKVILSKDALCREYLPLHGNTYWAGKTPNLDELAAKGTVFRNHFVSAPSTVMSFFSMCTGLFNHETDYEMYEKAHIPFEGETIFSKAKELGYTECHLIWDETWKTMSHYIDYYRDDVKQHLIKDLGQPVGPHFKHTHVLEPDKEKEENTLAAVEAEVRSILEGADDVFLWVHLPHVINGRVAYGSDIDLFDRYVGMIRKYVPDEDIIITADHGNMNGRRGKLGYGFDVHNAAIAVPLITPRINDLTEYEGNTSNADLFGLVFKGEITQRRFVYCDTAYRAQKHRTLAIMCDSYKYVYHKKTGKEELYDLAVDPNEEFSLFDDMLYDVDRKLHMQIREEFFHPDWPAVRRMRQTLREEKERLWRNGSLRVVIKSNLKDLVRPLYVVLTRK